MKKNLFSFIICLVFCSGAFAQASLNTAVLNMNDGLLDKAKANIDEACQHEKGKSKSKTWLYKGEIYARIASSDVNLPFFSLDKNAVQVAYDSYQKAIELEVEKKGFYKDAVQGISNLHGTAINHAVNMYNQKDVAVAIKDLKIANTINPKDTVAVTYGAIMAIENKDDDNYLYFAEKLLSMDAPFSQKQPHYVNVAVVYRDEKKDSNKAIQIIERGLKENAKSRELMIFLGELYVFNDQKEKSIEIYKNAYALYPNEFIFCANLGKLYFNKATENYKKLSGLSNQLKSEEAKKLNDEIVAELRNALPFLEKAHAIDSDNFDVMDLLSITYNELDMKDKKKAMDAKIEASKKQ